MSEHPTSPAPAPAFGYQAPAQWAVRLAWITIGLATLVGMFDSAVNVAFPAITNGFGIATGDIQWIITIYVLSQSCLTIAFGKIADRYGHRQVLMTGLAISALALLLCSVSTRYVSLVGFRFGQGIGIGLIMACAPAVASFLMAPERRREAMGYYTMWLGLGLSLGPLVGGYLVSGAGWPGVFWMRVPIALIALILVWQLSFIGRSNELLTGRKHGATLPADYLGAAWLVLSLGSLVFFLVQLRVQTWGIAPAVVALLIGGLSLRQFWCAELRAHDPVIDVTLFRSAPFRNLQIAAVMTNLTSFSLFLVAPFLFIQWPGFSVIESGYLLSLYPIGMLAAGLLSARLSAWLSAQVLIMTGMLVLTAGLLLCALFSSELLVAGMAAAMLVSGLGQGTFQVGHLDATLGAMPTADRGVAGSIVNVVRLLGIILSATGILWLHEAMADPVQRFSLQYARTFAAAGAAMGLYCVLYQFRRQNNE